MRRDLAHCIRLTCGLAAASTLVFLAGCETPQAEKKTSMLQQPMGGVYREGGLRPVTSNLRLGSYNIQDLTDGEKDGHMRTSAVVARQLDTAAGIINELNADILYIQEIENTNVLAQLNARIKPPYPLTYISNFESGRRTTKRNIALLSRLELLHVSELDMGHINDPVHLSRGALASVVPLGGDHFLLSYGVHLKSNFGKDDGDDEKNIAKRSEALKRIRAHADLVMSSNPALKWEVAVAGDMNVDPELEGFAHDQSLAPLDSWHDLWLGRPLEERITIPTRFGDPDLEFPSACFDRIIVSDELVRSPWKVAGIEVLQRGVDTENVFTSAGQNELHASDHYPVYIDIQR